jgi:hypothetical protein
MELDENSFPFKALEISKDVYDRTYTDEDFADYFKNFISNGVFPNPSTNLKVLSQSNNLNLTVKNGAGFINGRGYQLKKDKIIKINDADKNYNRKDIIFLQSDPIISREIKILYKVGTPASNPIKPSLIRNSDIWELELCEILVKSNITTIMPIDITDSRLNSNLCGFVVGLIQQIDTTNIFNSYQNLINQAQNNIIDFENEYKAWFISIKTEIFDKKYFDFNNNMYRKGYSYSYTKTGTDFSETIKNTLDNSTYATRESKKTTNKWVIRTICKTQDIDISETFTKNNLLWSGVII